jgi:hypothetical protein
MLDSGRVESTGLVGFAQAPIVLNDSLRLRVPTDRLRRKFLSAYELGRRGAAPTVETAYVTSAAILTRTPGIVPLFAWPTSVGWCSPGPPALTPKALETGFVRRP